MLLSRAEKASLEEHIPAFDVVHLSLSASCDGTTCTAVMQSVACSSNILAIRSVSQAWDWLVQRSEMLLGNCWTVTGSFK